LAAAADVVLWHAEQQRTVLVAHSGAVVMVMPGFASWIHRRWKTRPPGEAPTY
jgi:lauroyl/myristoyl acyltransferase